MPSQSFDEKSSQLRDIISRLESPITDVQDLKTLLAAPLHSINILPPQYIQHDTSPLPTNSLIVAKHIPTFQRVLLEYIVPTWEPILKEEGSFSLVEQYFCPDAFSFTSPVSAEIATNAYSTILSLPLTSYSISCLIMLSKSYPIDVLWSSYFSKMQSNRRDRHPISWEDCIRNVSAIPSKVANARGPTGNIPKELEYGPYFDNVSLRTEVLVSSPRYGHSKEDYEAVSYLLTKLVNIGVFPPSKPSLPSQPSFFKSTLRAIRAKIRTQAQYSSPWPKVISALASTLTLQAVLTSLFSHIDTVSSDLDGSSRARGLVKREATLLREVLGNPVKDKTEIWDGVSAVVIGRDWDISHARTFVCWIAGAGKGKPDSQALGVFLQTVIDIWTTPDHIRHSLLSKHRYLTALLLLTISYLPSSSSVVASLTMSPPFITSISTYISHMDASVRRCGMLVAEDVARKAGKKLDFGQWDGDGEGRDWCRSLRDLVKERDVDFEFEEDSDDEGVPSEENVAPKVEPPPLNKVPPKVTKTTSRKPLVQELYDSDDSLTGYASEPSSSRSPSPTPSELDEIEKDPTLRVGQKKVPRPVYLAQLGEMVRPTGGLKSDIEEGEVTRIEVALDAAEELIRRKRNYGTELEENAVNLVYGFVGLQNNYDLEDFNQKRQAALNALVACCPRRAAPAIIEEFFKNQYSTDQRYAMLNALALGARELASLPIPLSAALQPSNASKIAFASKRLPSSLHDRYITESDQPNALIPVQHLLEGISSEAIDKGREATANKVPEFVRERQLRIRPQAKVTEVRSGMMSSRLPPSQTTMVPETKFMDVAAEHFICPLINRFWVFLRDEQTREARTAHQSVLHQYRGAGTGLILNVVVLSHYLATLTVLVHASRNAKEWLAIIAPESLELAVTLGTRRLLEGEGENEDGDEGKIEIKVSPVAAESEPRTKEKGKGKEAAVLTTALELALIVLDGAVDLDGGKSLSLEHTALVLAVGEWASGVLSRLEKGARVLGGGGVQEIKLKRAAAGVVLKADEVASRWRRSMISAV